MMYSLWKYRVFSFMLFTSVVQISRTESGYFWHVTDFHYDPTYWGAGLSCQKDVSSPGPFGEYWCDSNWRLVQDSIDNMRNIKSNVDFVIWTGDSVAHISDENTSLAQNVDVIQNITDALKNAFPPNVKFFPCLGNHDFSPSDQANVEEDEFYRKTSDVWSEWISDVHQHRLYTKGGFYTLPISGKLRLMSLNTNLYYNKNKKVHNNMDDPAGQFEWMDSVLLQARNDDEKVIVTAHVPPGMLTPNLVPWMYSMLQERFVDILVKYSDVIVSSHYGHEHCDGFRIVQKWKEGKQAVPQFLAPSVTPWKYMLTAPARNPGIRLVEYDRTTGNHLNYVQYYINLTETNTKRQSQWTKLYDFRETYQVKDMSVKSLREIFTKMADGDDGMDLAQTYCNNNLVSKHNKTCTKKNRFEIVCGGMHPDFHAARSCVNEYLFGAASGLDLSFTTLIVSLTIAMIRP